jgi:cellulose synthase/poly-beta-1,6-N-acetylglucosamine synthase-like glycosyltransferase
LYKIILSFYSRVSNEDYKEITSFPVYTILLPVYKETGVINKLIESISNIDYPKDKLDVKILIEEDDKLMIQHLNGLSTPNYFKKVIVPHGKIKTKPNACNYGLKTATGEFLTIYDAEDIPEPSQLKKAVYKFNSLPKEYVCLQARLNWFNCKENILTRLFCIEYATWFDFFIKGVAKIDSIFPLGGTSNHFKTSVLKKLNGWDAENVTEDAELGIRLRIEGYKTSFLDSITYEESVIDIKSWIKQRTRWNKGYIQTFLKHIRNKKLYTNFYLRDYFSFLTFIFGTFFVNLINPILYFFFTSWLFFDPEYIQVLFENTPYFLLLFCLIAGNFSMILVSYFASRKFKCAICSILLPFYWLLMSIATYRALWQNIFNPTLWEKTEHGKTNITFNNDTFNS